MFNIGDKVVYKGEAGLDGLFEVESLTKTGKPKTVKSGRFGNFPCRYCTVRHATEEEIQAGRRLDTLNDFGFDFKQQPSNTVDLGMQMLEEG